MFHIHHLATVVTWLAISILSVDVGMVLYVFYRRAVRRSYYERKDAARARFSPALAATDSRSLIAAFGAASDPAERDVIEELLLGSITSDNWQQRTEALVELGFVASWSRQAFGRRRGRALLAAARAPQIGSGTSRRRFARIRCVRVLAIRRALAVIQLGQLAPEYSRGFLAEALRDPRRWCDAWPLSPWDAIGLAAA